MNNTSIQLAEETIAQKIYLIRGQKVMLDRDLAEMYNVEVKRLNEAVRRNINRFPEDFMFQLTRQEAESSRSQIATLNKVRGSNIKYLPYAFTEQGVAMLSSVLKSDRAIDVNIQIMRTFTKIRQMLADNTEVRLEIEKIKKKLDNHGKNIELVFNYLDQLLEKQETPPSRKQIGFRKNK